MKSIIQVWKFVFTYAPFWAIARILQGILICFATPLSVRYVETLIDQCVNYAKGLAGLDNIAMTGFTLSLFMLILAANNLINQLIDTSMRRNIENRLPEEIIRKFLSIPYSNFEDSDIQNVLQRMGKTPQKTICEIFSGMMTVITSGISLGGTALLFADISLLFPAGFLVFLTIMIYCDFHAMWMMNSMYQRQSVQERWLEYLTKLLCEKDSLYGLKVLQAIAFVHNKMDQFLESVQKQRLKAGFFTQKYMLVSSLAFKAWIAFLLFFMVYALRQGSVTIGAFVSLISATDLIISLVDRISYNITTLSLQYNQVANLTTFLHLNEKTDHFNASSIDYTSEKVANEQKKILIEFKNVSFRYPHMEKYVLNNLSFIIYPGENIAIVGENGCGKSTIMKLLCGLYEPERGEIFLGGKEIHSISQKERIKFISIVFQDYFKYYLTLRENVAFGQIEEIDHDTAILNALQRGNALGILGKCPGGNLDTNLGNIHTYGINLSGGEWQKIATSRGNLAESHFIIMDEPTAALDPTAENEMYTTFVGILKRKGQGSVIISHRLASAKISDRILVIKDGHVFEEGSHDELMQQPEGYYRSMFEAQSVWYRKEEA